MDELARRFTELSDKYGPDVVQAVLGTARVEGYSRLVHGSFLILLGIVALLVSWRLYKREEGDVILQQAGSLILAWVSLFLSVAGLMWWIDPWTWTAISHPELWVAKKVFRL